MTRDDLERTEKFLHENIPLTRAMGVRVAAAPPSFAIEAPVALNYNHLRTAFGGSINAVATLAAYVFVWLRLGDGAFRVVVQESAIRFVRPVAEMIRARCEPPGEEELNVFDATLVAQGRARLKLHVIVEEKNVTAAEFTGTFVALKR